MVVMGAQGVQSENDIQGAKRPAPGRYHAVIKSIDESFSKAENAIIIEFEILDGTMPGQQGCTVTERFYTSEKALPRLQRLAIVLGLLQPNEASKDIVFATAQSYQLIIEVEDNNYTDSNGNAKVTSNVTYMGIWSLGNAEVADVSRNMNALQYAQAGAVATNTAPVTNQPVQHINSQPSQPPQQMLQPNQPGQTAVVPAAPGQPQPPQQAPGQQPPQPPQQQYAPPQPEQAAQAQQQPQSGQPPQPGQPGQQNWSGI